MHTGHVHRPAASTHFEELVKRFASALLRKSMEWLHSLHLRSVLVSSIVYPFYDGVDQADSSDADQG